MNKEEREVLKKVSSSPKGLLSQSDLLSYVPNRNTKISHFLITSGLIEEVKRNIKATGIEATFYRLTEKGRIALKPLYERLWLSIKGDIRTIIVSIITALLTTAITILVTSHYKE